MTSIKSKQCTKTRILDAAEVLFAERGFDGASLRDITSAAGVNLSVVYYYFKSKEDLLRAVIERYLMPIVSEEKSLFTEAKTAASGAPLSVRKLLEIFVLPRLRNASDNAMRLCEMVFSGNGLTQKKTFRALSDITEEISDAYEQEFSRALPQLSLPELKLRLACLHLTIHGMQKFSPILRLRLSQTISKETYLEMLLRSFEAVLLAKPTI